MSSDLLRRSDATALYTTKGKVNGYQCELWHDGLGEHCVLRASDPSILENKVIARQLQWSTKWERMTEKRQIAASHQASAEEAEQRTRAAEQELANARSLLAATLRVNDAVNWESLKDHRVFIFHDCQRFPKVQFDQRGQPIAAVQQDLPPEPPRHSPRFQPALSLLDRLFASRKTKRMQEAEQRYTTAMQQWRAECQAVESANQQNQTMLQAATVAYQTAARAFQARQREANEKVDQLRERYARGDAEAVIQNCELVLNTSVYPDFVSKNFTVTYNAETRLLVVDYSLPTPAAMPTLTKVTYSKARQELKETHLTDKQHQQLYDDVLYQITLRTVHELFEADTAQVLASIVFNGWVEEVNQATGHRENACIVTLQVTKPEFLALNLSQIDPKACFKKLKGVAASTLIGLTPVQPLVQLTTEDERFVPSYAVAQHLDHGTNLATIDWKDFEHLVRELFEKEFASSGAEVKVTRASADGGVDAVIFDPDPIRGGKIVIQAKRYTNTVDVAAVRDLYGTVMNEGANKGILVTTSDYGPDAYSFIRDKPLTLLNGANLLHLLGKHGHRARIDIREAKSARKPPT